MEKRKVPLIAAHRGTCGGNIPCNSLAAFDTALNQGADIIELDVTRAQDGTLYILHPGMEWAHLGEHGRVPDMTAEQADALRYVNMDRTPTQFGLVRFTDALEHLRHRCRINVDKFFDHPLEIAQAIRSMGMQEDVIVKTPSGAAWFDKVETLAPDMPYIAVTHHDDFTPDLRKRNMRYIGTEVLFSDDTHGLASREYVDWMHAQGLIVWVNSIVYDYNTVLTGGHNDDISVVGREDEGWGWLIDRGFDIIQTDWVLPLRVYMYKRGLIEKI